jgi:hypothetical protein
MNHGKALTDYFELSGLRGRAALSIGRRAGIRSSILSHNLADGQGPVVKHAMPTLHWQRSALWKKKMMIY